MHAPRLLALQKKTDMPSHRKTKGKMKKIKFKITTISEDIRQINHIAKTGNQDMTRFCRDHHDPVLLEDNLPVLNKIYQDQFIRMFDLQFNHYFPEPEMMYRFGIYHNLQLPNLLALMLKAGWELYFSEMIGYTSGSGINLEERLKNRLLVKQFITGYRPENKEMFQLVKELPYETRIARSRENLNQIISDLIHDQNFLLGNDQIDRFFPEKAHHERLLLNGGTIAQQEEYYRLKDLWQTRSTELEEKLLLLEKKKRMNLNTEDRYFKYFGKHIISRASLTYQIHKYKKILELKNIRPEAPFKELLKKAIDSITEEERQNQELSNKYARSLNFLDESMGECSGHFSSPDLLKYDEEVKKILKKLYFLLHPDLLDHRPVAEVDRKRLNKLWMELMRQTEEKEYSFTPRFLMYSHPDYYKLMSILKRACKILRIDMDNLEVGDQLTSLIRKGSSLKELLEFLKKDAEKLQLHLTNLDLVQQDYSNDRQAQFYREALLDKDQYRVKLNKEITACREDIIQLKKIIRKEFKKVAT